MNLNTQHKIDTSFSMSSMTDIVFLLLIFFMLTTSFSPLEGVPIDLPSSKVTQPIVPTVSIILTSDLKYYVNDVQVPFAQLEKTLCKKLNKPGSTVILQVDKTVPIAYVMKVAGIAAALDAKISVATKLE